MKLAHLFLILTVWTLIALAQSPSAKLEKPALDTSAFFNWPSVEQQAGISNDGKYAFYSIRDHHTKPATLIIKAIGGEWKFVAPNAGSAAFTEDSRTVICMKSNDSLCLIALGRSAVEYIPKVGSFQLFMQGKTEWMAYQSRVENKNLLLRNLDNAKEQSFPGIAEYVTSKDGNVVVLVSGSEKDTTIAQTLSVVNLSTGSRKQIWAGMKASNIVLDDTGMQLAFVVEGSSKNQTVKSIWHYKAGENKASQLVDSQPAGIGDDMQVDGVLRFSMDARRLFIRLKEKEQKPKPDAVKVDVWSYHDAKLQSEQLLESQGGRSRYLAVIQLNEGRIVNIQRKGEAMAGMLRSGTDDFVVFDDTKGNRREEANWSVAAKPSFYLVSTRNGERIRLELIFRNVSPDGKYVIGHKLRESNESRGLCSYEISTGSIYNITESVRIPVETDDYNLTKPKNLLFVGWVASDPTRFLVYDKFDIWKVDPTGREAPVNVTNGYGRRNNIQLRLANERDYTADGKTIAKNDWLLLHAFDLKTKNQGFYRFSLGKTGDPQRLTMGPYDYKPAFPAGFSSKSTPLKARDAEIYLVKRSSATESPNYFWTKDFKTFSRISEVTPEIDYNWLTTELVSFKTIDGHTCQAVIYKPENFDPKNKYPVILHYYEQKSQKLNEYQTLFNHDQMDISIPWFVSHEYVVVTPDIYYHEKAKNGQAALNAVLGVADYLSRLPCVDAKHIAIHGQSFGGFETNYIVTHTTRFAAAISSSGMSNLISDYLDLWGGGVAKQGYYENRQGRMGATLWEKPELYIENSPILMVDKITTPMLLVANKNDGNVSFKQGLELFLASRRLGKKVWMLQYDGEDHGLGGKGFIDFTIRSQQFFDHYLKGLPAPKWMTRGIPGAMKGVDDGLELDHEIKTPGPGLLIEESNKRQKPDVGKEMKDNPND